MFALLPSLALAADVTLHVGVPTTLGSPSDVVVDGASGPCQASEARLRCPATGPVLFSWPGDEHVLHGTTTLTPGDDGRAWVLAAPGRDAATVQTLTALREDGDIDRHDLLALRRAVVLTSDWTPPWPSRAGLDAHVDLLDHPDPRVRREAVEGLFPWVAGTPFDPLPVQAPIPVDHAVLRALAEDPDKGVRRRLAHQLRTARPDVPRDLVRDLLLALLDDPHPGVRRATVVAVPEAVDRGVLPARDAWDRLLAMVPQPAPPGRAACNQLARMRARLARAGVRVEPEPALEAVLRHHPERAWRVWAAWRDALPVHARWIRRLLDDTTGLSPTLVAHWHAAAPDVLDEVVAAWHPRIHPERRDLLLRLLDASAAASDEDGADPPEPGPPAE